MSKLPIHHTFAPLALPQQQVLAFNLLIRPWRWRKGRQVADLRSALTEKFQRHTFLFDGGRSALAAGLKALALQPGDEVIVQGYTCVVVPNAVMAAGGIPIYADIEKETLNLSLDAVRAVITPKTRAIICQHTFGIPADTAGLRQICDEHQLALIEDCAHVMPEQADTAVGTHGDILIFSFGRDKAISGVAGGAVLTRHTALSQPIGILEQQAPDCTRRSIVLFLLYPMLYATAKYSWPTGKALLRAARLCRLLPAIVSTTEKHGTPPTTIRRLPNALAALALQQLRQLPALNAHRRQIAALFAAAARNAQWQVPSGVDHAIALQKFPLFTKNADAIRANLKRQHIYLDDGWCGQVVNPRAVDQVAAGYTNGRCPIAETVSTTILTLPTHPTMGIAQANTLIASLQQEFDRTATRM